MLKLIVKPYVDKYFDGNINRFAFAIGTNYNPAKGLYSGETTRLQFSTLTELCRIFHCTPNDLFVEAGPNGDGPYISVEEAFCNIKHNKEKINWSNTISNKDDIKEFVSNLHNIKETTDQNQKVLQELLSRITSESERAAYPNDRKAKKDDK